MYDKTLLRDKLEQINEAVARIEKRFSSYRDTFRFHDNRAQSRQIGCHSYAAYRDRRELQENR